MPKRYRRNASGLGLGLCLLALLWAPPASGDKRDDELERKATLFRDALVERHLSREGVVLYRVNLQTIQSDLQDGRYPNLADAPTFTGQLAAAMCARAKKAETPEADLALAEIALSGLEALMHVTGRPGLFARSLRRDAGRDVTGLSGDCTRRTRPMRISCSDRTRRRISTQTGSFPRSPSARSDSLDDRVT